MLKQSSVDGDRCWVALDKRGLGEDEMAELRDARKRGMTVAAFVQTINPHHPANDEHIKLVYKSQELEREAEQYDATAEEDDLFPALSVDQVYEDEGLSLYGRAPYSS